MSFILLQIQNNYSHFYFLVHIDTESEAYINSGQASSYTSIQNQWCANHICAGLDSCSGFDRIKHALPPVVQQGSNAGHETNSETHVVECLHSLWKLSRFPGSFFMQCCSHCRLFALHLRWRRTVSVSQDLQVGEGKIRILKCFPPSHHPLFRGPK